MQPPALIVRVDGDGTLAAAVSPFALEVFAERTDGETAVLPACRQQRQAV